MEIAPYGTAVTCENSVCVRDIRLVLGDEMLRSEYVRRSAQHGGWEIIRVRAEALIDGLAFGYECVSGVPATNLRDHLRTIPQDKLAGWLRGEYETETLLFS